MLTAERFILDFTPGARRERWMLPSRTRQDHKKRRRSPQVRGPHDHGRGSVRRPQRRRHFEDRGLSVLEPRA